MMTAIPVTVDNFVRAESDMYFNRMASIDGGFAKYNHHRELMSVARQPVIRGNRDTIYSPSVFDLDAGPVTVTMPDPGTRLMTMLVIDQDHYVHGVFYGAGEHTFSREQIGTRYVALPIRTLVNPHDPADVRRVHALQDAVLVRQKSPGRFELPVWDQSSQKRLREALLVLGETVPDTRGMFGARNAVDPVRHLIGTALGWGGNPEKDALYLNVTPAKNDGGTVYRIRVTDVPVDAFWSISVYNAQGYFEPNARGAYSVNNITATKEADGSIIVQFGGCDSHAPNCLPITRGWNYLVRLYRPRAEILDGTWIFPTAQPAAIATPLAVPTTV
jgi:hypothetical protein